MVWDLGLSTTAPIVVLKMEFYQEIGVVDFFGVIKMLG